MSLYADQPSRRLRQVVGDALVVGWVVAWVVVGRAVHDAVSRLAAPGRTLEGAGTAMAQGLGEAGGTVAEVPLVGDRLSGPLTSAGDAARSLAGAGQDLQDGVAHLALVSALAVAGWPVLVVVVLWLRSRLRFARRSAAARRLLGRREGHPDPAGVDLLALRALVRLPVGVLGEVSADPAGDWRRGDDRVVRRLAALELQEVGIALGDQA